MWWGAYATLCLSLVSAVSAFLSLRLNTRRERRDADAKHPLAEFTLHLTGPTGCEIDCRLLNRGDRPIVLEMIAIVGGAWCFVADASGPRFQTLPMRTVIEPSERFRRTYALRANSGLDAFSRAEITLSFSGRQQGQDLPFRCQITRHST